MKKIDWDFVGMWITEMVSRLAIFGVLMLLIIQSAR